LTPTGTDLLRRAILERGRVEGTLLKVDDFLNHRVDPELIAAVGADLAARFADAAPQVSSPPKRAASPPPSPAR
jgi:hypothetical protein